MFFTGSNPVYLSQSHNIANTLFAMRFAMTPLYLFCRIAIQTGAPSPLLLQLLNLA